MPDFDTWPTTFDTVYSWYAFLKLVPQRGLQLNNCVMDGQDRVSLSFDQLKTSKLIAFFFFSVLDEFDSVNLKVRETLH